MIDSPALDSAVHMPYGDGTLESHRVLFAQNIPAVEGLGGELDVTGRRCLAAGRERPRACSRFADEPAERGSSRQIARGPGPPLRTRCPCESP
jgi:hypothetical protein